MNEGLRGELLRRVRDGRDAFAAVERLMTTDAPFAAEVERRGAGGFPLVLLDWPDAPAPFRNMVAVDAGNSTWFAEVVAEHGWPGVALAGADGEEAAWELAMHADTTQAQRLGWLALIDVAAQIGDVPLEHAELLRLRTEAVAALGLASTDTMAFMATERWETDEDLIAARLRFSESIPGYEPPAAYSLARVDDGQLTFGHVNDVGGFHRLPAAVLATICGYVSSTGTFPMTEQQVRQAIELLAPAEAARHVDHPNLWSWRTLLDDARPDSSFVALFVRDPSDPIVDADDERFRARLADQGRGGPP